MNYKAMFERPTERQIVKISITQNSDYSTEMFITDELTFNGHGTTLQPNEYFHIGPESGYCCKSSHQSF